jgi:hypothetical protein
MLNQGQHCFSPMPGMDSIDELSAAFTAFVSMMRNSKTVSCYVIVITLSVSDFFV